MESCKICGAAITGRFHGVATEMACVKCGQQATEAESKSNIPLLLRGVLFALAAAFATGLLRWGFEALVMGPRDCDFIETIMAFVRTFVYLATAFAIVGAAKAGSRGKGGILLQRATLHAQSSQGHQ